MSNSILCWTRRIADRRRRNGGVRDPGIIGLANRLREGHEARVRRAIAERPRDLETLPPRRKTGSGR